MPLGGIGTGTVSLGGRGDLRDWELMNRPAKGYIPEAAGVGPFFSLWVKPAGGPAVARILEGPLRADEYEGSSGCETPQHGFPRFGEAQFRAAYPLGTVELTDAAVPVRVTLQAFNPMIPGNTPDSSLPVVMLRYVVHNPGSAPVQATVCGSLPNYIGIDGSVIGPPAPNWDRPYIGAKNNRIAFRKGASVQGLWMTSEGVDPKAEAWGTMALTCAADADTSHRTNWPVQKWGYHKRHFWEDLLADGRLENPGGLSNMPIGSLAQHREIPAGASAEFTFYLTWHFPNRMTWTQDPARPYDNFVMHWSAENPCPPDNIVGNFYCTRFADAWAAAEHIVPRFPELEAETLRFVEAFCESSLPVEVKEAALFNTSTLRTQTCFQTADGKFYQWEGCHDRIGSCHGSCTHVWNYEHATPFLFADLARCAREIEFAHATNAQGHMPFRVPLPLARIADPSKIYGVAAADGQMGCLMKLYREWQLCGDDAWLKALWPHARRAMEFCWIPNGWDADQDGVMEGCQHNTMDVEYFGPNPQMAFWYLGALAACERMAARVGDTAFAARCADLRKRGSAWVDTHLFNGEYYRHEVRPPMSVDRIAPGLRTKMGTDDLANPDLQLADGCLIDQLVGQFTAHVLGLGYLGDAGKMRATLNSILRYNRRTQFHDHFNHMRSYALGGESALLMASYPKGRPERPFPYYSEVMTGFEYVAAIHLIYEGQVEEGLRCIRDIRARYDGEKRNPFDEAECGHHYGRAMAAWAAVLALSGFRYSAVEQTMEFCGYPGTYFWSTGTAWGQVVIHELGAELRVLHGELKLKKLEVNGLRVATP